MNRRLWLGSVIALAVVGIPDDAAAKGRKRSSGKRRSARRGSTASGTRGTTESGDCPCNGGRVCVGPRGGRYCITRGGNKRYGV